MARKKRSKSASSKKRTKRKVKPKGPPIPPPATTMAETLERVPEKEYLSTREVQLIFGIQSEVTIYRWVKRKELKAYRVRTRGKANVFKRDEVIAAVRARFTPRDFSRSD